VDLVFHLGLEPDEGGAGAEDLPRIPHRARGDVGRREQIGAQQVGQGGRIDLIGLDPRTGDGLGLQRMGQHQIRVPVLDQLIEVGPVPRGLDRDTGVRPQPREIAL